MNRRNEFIVARKSNGSLLEILVCRDRILMSERNGGQQMERLVKLLARMGLEIKMVFKSPCG